MTAPLDNLKILDFSTLLPGPFATMMMADMGADVLRVSSGSRPDLAALLPPFLPGSKVSANIAYLGRGKRSLTLNLKDPRALQVIDRLLGKYDILVEQFRPGVMEKLGLGYETLSGKYPALIYCSITGYGQKGSFRNRAGHDINYLARSGLMSYSCSKKGGPALMGLQIADIVGGSFNAVIGLLAAVCHRERTGDGQQIDIAMMDGVMALNALVGAAYLVDGKEPKSDSLLLNGGSLYDFYETRDHRHISFGGLEPQFFSAFCKKIGRPDLIAKGVMPPDIEIVKEEVRDIIRTRTMDEWLQVFGDADVCVEPVLTIPEAMENEAVDERGLIVDISRPEGGSVRQLSNPIKFSKSPVHYTTVGVRAGTHNREVLLELGYTDQDINAFADSGLFE
jgi:crotonobetainyl-CoA:carnitine CoA-transferase CaiB-like acyl-CoA transferase